ncbi:early nodulin-93-like [Bidens hawaiensis]|uniref:early nodulin-93-like n=1 Tax=Bidens hawaiensis TaxID=980011 RepID=UPI00404AEDF6
MSKSDAKVGLPGSGLASLDQKLAIAKRCSHEGVVAGAKAATIATAIPTVASARMVPWARAHLNPTAQALIVSTFAGAAYFIVADKTVLKAARMNSFNNDVQP